MSNVTKIVQVNVAKGLLSIITTNISFFKEFFDPEEIDFVHISLAPQKSCTYPWKAKVKIWPPEVKRPPPLLLESYRIYSLRTYARSITLQPSEKRLTIFHEYGARLCEREPCHYYASFLTGGCVCTQGKWLVPGVRTFKTHRWRRTEKAEKSTK